MSKYQIKTARGKINDMLQVIMLDKNYDNLNSKSKSAIETLIQIANKVKYENKFNKI